MARAMQRVFLPLVRLAMPELVDYDMPEFAAARHWAAVSIRKTYAGQGRRAAHAAWGLRPMMFAKMLVVVDDDVDVRDQQAVLAAVAANMQSRPRRFDRARPARPVRSRRDRRRLGQKMAIDATRKTGAGIARDNPSNSIRIAHLDGLPGEPVHLNQAGGRYEGCLH